MDTVTAFNTTSIGLVYDFARNKDNEFPVCHASIIETNIGQGETEISYDIIAIDLPLEDESDMMTKLYAMHEALNEVISNYINTTQTANIELPVNLQALDKFVEHTACGWRATLTITLANENSVC